MWSEMCVGGGGGGGGSDHVYERGQNSHVYNHGQGRGQEGRRGRSFPGVKLTLNVFDSLFSSEQFSHLTQQDREELGITFMSEGEFW